MTRVKICGVSDPADARRVAELGAWALGMIFWPQSPRVCSLEAAEQIGAELQRRLELVGVFVNATLDEVADKVDHCHLSVVQLHGDEGPAYCREVARRTGAKVMKAGASAGRRAACTTSSASTRTSTCSTPTRRARREGRARPSTGSWRGCTPTRPRSCSRAGWTPTTSARRSSWRGPFAVDVASGTEAAPGRKDPAKLTAFVRAVEQADARLGAVA